MKKYFTVLFILVLPMFTHAQQRDFAKLNAFLDTLSVHHQAMGSLAISKNGHIVYQRSIGYRYIDGSNKVAADENTMYRIGSISKMFTAVMVFQLIDEGKLHLDDKLSKWFPSIPNAAEITIAHMLAHHSGIHNFTDVPDYRSWYTRPQTEAEIVKLIARNKPDFEPGKKGEYSNSNFTLLGFIVEHVGKRPYAQALQTRVCDKAGLRNTHLGGNVDKTQNEAFSYNYIAGNWVVEPSTDMSVPGGAGAVVSTPSDLTMFITALFRGRLMSAASLTKMTTIKDGLGMGMLQFPYYNRVALGHNGRIDNFSSSLSYFTDDSMSFSFIQNGGDYPLNDVVIAIINTWYNKPIVIPDFNKPEYVMIADPAIYVGTYAAPNFPMKITVSVTDGTLMAQASGQKSFPLKPTDKDMFSFDAAGIEMIFEPSDKKMTLKQHGMVVHFTQE